MYVCICENAHHGFLDLRKIQPVKYIYITILIFTKEFCNSLFSLGEVQGGGSDLFDKMYYKEGNFTRGRFFTDDPKSIEFKSGSYKIVGEMGTTHDAVIKIQIFAEQKEKALKETKADEGVSSESSDSD